jgi:hypothetical protein
MGGHTYTRNRVTSNSERKGRGKHSRYIAMSLKPTLGLGGGLLPARVGKKRKDNSEFFDNADAPTISLGSSGRPCGSGSGPSRESQMRATQASALARRARGQQDEGGDDNDGPARSLDQPSEHADKTRKQHEAWGNSLPWLRERYMACLPSNISRAKGQASSLRSAIQAELAADTYCCPKCPHPQPEHSKEQDGIVWYYGLDGCFQLTMYKRTCKGCKQVFTPHALDFGCFPSTPVTPHVWYDLRVLSLYKKLGPLDGLSQTGKFIRKGA